MAERLVVITTFGSLGDLHPYLAVGQALQGRGYAVRVATLAVFRQRVEAAGLEFWPLRAAPIERPTPELMRRVFDGAAGAEFLVRQLVLPSLRTAYADTLAAAQGAAVLVGHPLTFATRVVAEQMGVPWLSTQLAPSGLISAYDRPLLPGLGWLRRVGAGVGVYRMAIALGERVTARWMGPLAALRQELGLGEGGHPLFAGGHSPWGVLALFSPLLVTPQPDWPARVTVAGFPFYRQEVARNEVLERWLAAGEAPVVFTLGSSAVMAAGEFFRESARAARQLGMRALLVGPGAETFGDYGRLGQQAVEGTGFAGGDDVLAVPYASYAEVFRRGRATVHQGGIGTTAEALRVGRPMLVVPFGVDQPDNGARVEQLGVGRVLSRRRYRSASVAELLQQLLSSGAAGRARAVGETVEAEEGAARAAEAIVRVAEDGANLAAGQTRLG